MKISDIVQFNPFRPLARGTTAPFVEMASLTENQRDIAGVSSKIFSGGGSRFYNGDTLFARITPCLENGKTAKVRGLPDGGVGHGSTEFIVMAAKDPAYDEDFVYYLARLPEFRRFAQARMEGTSGRQRVSWKSLSSYSLPYLSPEHRKNAGGFLCMLDDKIDLNRRINATMDQISRTIFQAWFVDFLPVRAKIAARAEGQDPLRAAMRTLSGKDEAGLDALPLEQYERLAMTANVFPDALVNSELGEIPLGWSFGLMADMCVLNAKSWGTKTLPDVVHYVDLTSTYNGEILDVQTFTRDAVPSRARRVLRAGDVIVGTVRPANRSFALIGELEHPLTGSTGFAVLSPRSPEVREFVYLAATSERNIERLHRLADGGAYPAVRPEEVVNERVVLPPSEVLAAFHQITCPMFERMLLNRKSNKTLGALRDTLLPRLLSGELQIPGVR